MHRLKISITEKENLVKLSREAAGRIAQKALIVLWFDEGKTQAEIVQLLDLSIRRQGEFF